MRSFLPATVPWGRPGLPDIPLPPFATPDDHRRYLHLLRLYVALIDDGEPSLSTKVLCEVLERPWPRTPPESGDLTRLELQVSLATFFPAPWTPAALAQALPGLGRQDTPRALDGGAWNWGYDPDFTARPVAEGGWEIERHERGSRTTATLAADGDLALLWMADFSTRHSYPFGYSVEEAEARTLAPAVAAVREAHAVDTAYPYMANWRERRDAAMRDASRSPTTRS